MIHTVNSERARIQRDVGERVENLLTAVDRQIASIQAEFQVLAVSPSLQSGDFVAFDRQMRAALKIRGTSIVLHDIKAQQLLSTNQPFGEPLPRATNSEMHDRVVETGKPQISDLIIGAVLRRPILTVGVPVFRDGKVAVEHCYQRARRDAARRHPADRNEQYRRRQATSCRTSWRAVTASSSRCAIREPG